MRWTWLILIVFYLLPGALSVGIYNLAPIWIVAALTLAAFIIILGNHPSKTRRWLAAILSFITALGSVSLITSFDLQGEGFNNRFFFHYDLESLKIGISAFPHLVIGSTLYLLLGFLLPFTLPKEPLFTRWPHKVVLPVIGIASLFLFPPATSAFDYLQTQYKTNQSGGDAIRREVREVEVLPLSKKPKNLILIYGESLERIYFDETMFPGLMKNLNAQSSEALEFTNVYQQPGTGWTIAGIVASQCGLPFNVKYVDGQEANIALAAIEEPFKDEICLGDILDSYGYNTVFMGGAKLSFAGKGKFLDANGFDETLGLDELLPVVPDYKYTNKWGLYDDTLLDEAMDKIDELVAKDEPYFLSALTVDTHQPGGHIPKNCEPYAGEDIDILHALHCNDRIVGEFIQRLRDRGDMEDTLIVLFSDHLSMKNTLFDRLKKYNDERRLAWLVWGNNIEPGKSNAPATHFDVAPTLLEMMGIPNYHENNWGRSVWNGQEGYWHAQNPEAQKSIDDVKYMDMEGNSARQGIRIDANEATIYIGEKPFKATRAGFSMLDSIFMLALDKDGSVSSIMFSQNMKEFKRIAKDMTLVAVSYNEALAPEAVLAPKKSAGKLNKLAESDNELTSGEPEKPVKPLYYYIGTPSKDIAKTGVTDDTLFISSRNMRRVLKQKKLR